MPEETYESLLRRKRFPLWEAWIDALMRTKFPYTLPVKELPGYEDTEDFKHILFDFERFGLGKVDYWQGVSLSPAAVSFVMANVLHCGSGRFRQVCKHVLDQLASQGVDTSISGLFEKALDERGIRRLSMLFDKPYEDFF